MADIIVSVRSTGGDYISLAAALTAEQVDLVALNSNLRIQVYNDFGGILDANIDMNSYASLVTDETHRVYIEAPVGHRHTGRLGTGATISGNSTYNPPFKSGSHYVTLDWMIVHHRTANGLSSVAGGAYLDIKNSLVYSASDEQVSSMRSGYNSLFVSTNKGTDHPCVKVLSTRTTSIDYCTLIGGSYTGAGTSGGITATNCVVYNPNGAPYANPGPLVENLDGNVWSGATNYGTNSTSGLLTTDFTDYAAGDFSPVAASLADSKGANFVFSPAVISLPTSTDVTTASATIGATTNTTNGTLYLVIDTDANLASITGAQIVAGTNATDTAPEGGGSTSISTTTPSINITGMGLGVSTPYSYAITQVSDGGISNVITGTFTTPEAAIVPPTLSSAVATTDGPYAYTGSVSTDTANGTLYYLVTENSTETEGAILAGNQQVVSSAGAQEVAGVGLTPATNYYIHFVHSSSESANSNTLSSSVFTTDAELPSAATLSIATSLSAGVESVITTGYAGFNPTDINFVHKDGTTINLPITTAFVSGVGAVTVPALPATQSDWVKFGLGKVVLTDGVYTVNFHGAYANGYVDCTGVDGTLIPTGTKIKVTGETDSAKDYSVFSDVVISGGVAQVEVYASWAYDGTSNRASGTAMEFKSTISGLDSACVVASSGLTGGKKAVFTEVEPVLLPPPNFKVIQVRDASSAENSVFSEFIALPSDGCQLIYDTTKADIHTTGIFKSNFVGTQSIYLFDIEDNQIKSFSLQTDGIAVTDNTAPVIALNGSSTINLTVGDTYTELGATAIDDADGDITADIVTTGTVNTTTAATYTKYYNVSDAAGNAATQVTRLIIVSSTPNTAPTTPTITRPNSGMLAAGETDTLTASSTDAEDDTITYSWATTAGTLSASNGQSVVFTAPSGSSLVTATISATASDGSLTSVAGTIDIDVAAVVDTTPPVITVSGNPTTTVVYGGTLPIFIASALDDRDGVVSVVETGDTPNNTVAGTYVRRFNAVDSAGNQAVEVTRTIIVEAQVAITSSYTSSITGMLDGTYATRLIDTDNESILFFGTKAYVNGVTEFTSLEAPVGTNIEISILSTTKGALGRGITT